MSYYKQRIFITYLKSKKLFECDTGIYQCLVRLFWFSVIIIFLPAMSGCVSCPKPRLRVGAYFGAPFGIYYPDPNKLGKHDYKSSWGEKIGLVYTCKGGFIDLSHLRDSADRTAYCEHLIYDNLTEGNTDFSFKLLEPSKYIVTIKYPENWDTMLNKEAIKKDVAVSTAQYFSYVAMVWHEIITWYGYKYTGLFSEYISAFSWEDIYSDIIGIDIGGRVLRKSRSMDNYDEIMTSLISDELRQLDIQPVSVAKKAEKKIRGKWFDGIIYPFARLRKRNLDIGIDDGYVTPWLVPGICSNTTPVSYAVPEPDLLKKYGFSIELKIEPKIMESHKIFKTVYPDSDGKYILPSKNFPEIMKEITKQEIKRNGPKVNTPNL